MLRPVLVTAPDATPVSLTEVKAHCRVDDDDSDAVLTVLLNAAVNHLDGWTGILGRAMVTQTWRQDFEAFGCRRLPLGPAASITSITYYDGDNVQQTLADSVYVLRTDSLGAYVDLKPDQSWPSAYSRPDAVSVTYVAGVDAADVPAALKAAILLMVSHWNENREAVALGTIATTVPMSASALIRPYQRVGI